MRSLPFGLIILLLLALTPATPLSAQTGYTLHRFADETVQFAKQPTTWKAKDWLRVGIAGVGTVLVMQADQPIRNAALKDRSYYLTTPIEGGRIWGTWYATPLVAGAFGLHGWLSDNSSSRRIGYELVQAGIYSGVVVELLKGSAGRARPFLNKGAFTYRPFGLRNDFNSLPSGHSALAFSMSTVLSKHIHSPLLKGLVYAPSVLTLTSRVYQDFHWTSDVLLGATIGYFVGSWVVDTHAKEDSRVKLSVVFPATLRLEF